MIRQLNILALLCTVAICAGGCWKDDMASDSHATAFEASPFFANNSLARPLINGTVPRGGFMVDTPIYAVTVPGPEATSFPFQLNAKDLEIGHQKFDIFCAICHGATGEGDGMAVMRGFPHPPSYYLDRLRKAPPGHFFNVITHGKGAMFSYGDRIAPDDRWRIVGYIRALQLGDPNNNGLATTPPAQRK